MEKLKIAVTGSQGFIGSQLLYQQLYPDVIEWIPFSGDLLKQSDLDIFFTQHPQIDVCVHLAGLFVGDSRVLIDANLATTAAVVEHFRQHGCRKYIYTSTGAVYGDAYEDEASELTALQPNTEYGLIKKFAEDYLIWSAHEHQLEYVILRFPNVYGPGNQSTVLAKFLHSIKTEQNITLYGDGQQKRDFLHVEDACQAIALACLSDQTGIFNVSSPARFSLNEVIEQLKERYQFTVTHLPAEDKVKKLLLNYEKAQRILRFKPSYTTLKLD